MNDRDDAETRQEAVYICIRLAQKHTPPKPLKTIFYKRL